jgi:hypothetical protein
MPIHCSYCRNQGHNITQCNSPNIETYYTRIKQDYTDVLREGTNTNDRTKKNLFMYTLCHNYDSTLLKAVYCRYATRNPVSGTSKKLITEHIWLHFQDISLENMSEWLDSRSLPVTSLPTTADVVPPYAQDILEEPETETETETEEESEDSVMWSIDRTPSTITQEITPPSTPLISSSASELRLRRGVTELFIPFSLTPFELTPFSLTPRNLNDEFDNAINYMADLQTQTQIQTPVKKYNIAPTLSVIEPSELLEECQDCTICYENTKVVDTVTLNCGHNFCGPCVKGTLNAHNNMYADPCCALCRAPMTHFITKSTDIYNLVSEHCL